MAGAKEDKGKATDALGAMVAVVPIVLATDMGTLRDSNEREIACVLQKILQINKNTSVLERAIHQSTDFKRPVYGL